MSPSPRRATHGTNESHGGDPTGRSQAARAPAYAPAQEGTGAALRAFLRVVRRRLPILLVCAIMVPVAALAWSLHQEKEYESTASLLFREAHFDQSFNGGSFFSSSEDPTRAAETNIRLVSLGAVSSRTAKKLDIPGLTPAAVAGSVSVSSAGESDVADVSVTAPDPTLAARIANVFAREYIEYSRESDRETVLEAKVRVEAQYDQLTAQQRGETQGRRLVQQAEELAVLASLQTGNAELVQEATPNSTPVSPHPKRDTVLGLVLGLLLGVGLILLIEQFDTRIKTEEDVEAAFGMPILAKVPKGEKSSQSHSLDPIGLGAPGAEAFRLLHANLRYYNVGRKINSLVITSAASEEGKTTVSWGLSITEARSGKSVLLIEADMRQPNLAERLDKPVTSGLSLVLAEADPLEDAIVPIELAGAPDATMHVLPAGPIPPNSAELLESPQMAALIKQARGEYDLIVIDTPPVIVADSIPLMAQVSGVLVVVRLGRSRQDDAHNLRELLTHLNASALGTVVNGTAPARDGYYMPYAARVKTPA